MHGLYQESVCDRQCEWRLQLPEGSWTPGNLTLHRLVQGKTAGLFYTVSFGSTSAQWYDDRWDSRHGPSVGWTFLRGQ